MLVALAAAQVALLGVPRVYGSSGGCWKGEQCSPPVDVTLEDQGWGGHIVYTINLHVAAWKESATMSVLIRGQPAVLSAGHPHGCRIVESSESSISVALSGAAGDTCSAVLSTSRKVAPEDFIVLCSSQRRVTCPPPAPPPSPPSPFAPFPAPPPSLPPLPLLPPLPHAPEIALVRDDCFLGAHARFLVPPTGIAGVLWKVELEFDTWMVGAHVFLVFSRWDDGEHIDLSRFPVRLVDVDPKEAVTSPTADAAAAYKRPPGKLELVLEETPVTSVTLSLYGGARLLGALYCARPEGPPPSLPVHKPSRPPPLPPPDSPVNALHVKDEEAVIAGATYIDIGTGAKDKKKGLERIASLVVALVLFGLAMMAGGCAFLMRFVRILRWRLKGRKVHKRIIRAQQHQTDGGARGRRVKLLFEDEDGVEVAAYLDMDAVDGIAELHDHVLQTYESAGAQTYFSDVLALYYRDGGGRMELMTADTRIEDVAAGGLLRLTRDSKARRRRSQYARVSGNALDAEERYAQRPAGTAIDDDDDEDTFSLIMDEKERGHGTITLHSSAMVNGGRGGSRAVGSEVGGGDGSDGGDSYGDEEGAHGASDDSEDEADLIVRRHNHRERERAGAKSMAL